MRLNRYLSDPRLNVKFIFLFLEWLYICTCFRVLKKNYYDFYLLQLHLRIPQLPLRYFVSVNVSIFPSCCLIWLYCNFKPHNWNLISYNCNFIAQNCSFISYNYELISYNCYFIWIKCNLKPYSFLPYFDFFSHNHKLSFHNCGASGPMGTRATGVPSLNPSSRTFPDPAPPLSNPTLLPVITLSCLNKGKNAKYKS